MAARPTSPWHALRAQAVKRTLAAPARARTLHFVLHWAAAEPLVPELRTVGAPEPDRSVDNNSPQASIGVGFVIPKRLARRAVTRNLIRREMRDALRRHRARLPLGGSVLLRQRGAFERADYPSAASTALRTAVRKELDTLFAQLAGA